MEEILTMWKTMSVLVLVVGAFLFNDAQANPIRNGDSKEISKECYYCVGERQDVDNVAACSTEKNLNVEECSLEDHFDKCIVFQAFSLSRNTTIFKRECTSRRFCEERKICSDPDFLDCRYECCTGDLCNNFDFSRDVEGSRPQPQPTVAMTTQKYHELVQSESNENVLTVPKNTGQTTEPNIQDAESPIESAGGPTTRSLRTTSNEKLVSRDEAAVIPIRPVVEEHCVDLEVKCPTFVKNPSHWPTFCKQNDKYTSIACRKTCKFCISRDEVITTTVAPKVEDCKDLLEDCENLKSLGYCELVGNYMKRSCKKTCEFCIGETTVSNTASFVTEKVTSTTSGLQGQEGKMGVYTVPVNTERPVPDRTNKITPQATEKMTTKYLPTTDGELQSGIALKPTTETEVYFNTDCQDKRDNCAFYKAKDFCRIMIEFMDTYCRKTCGRCNDTSTAQEYKATAKSSSPSSQEISGKLTEHSTNPALAVTSSSTSSVTSSSTSMVTSSSTSAVTSSSTSPHTSQLTTVEAVTKKIINHTTSSTSKLTQEVSSSKSNILPTRQTTSNETNIPFRIPDKGCQDKKINCGFYKAMNFCRSMPFFVDENCRKTCGICSNETTVTKTARLMTGTVTTSGLHGKEGKMGVYTVPVNTEHPTTGRTSNITLQPTEETTRKSESPTQQQTTPKHTEEMTKSTLTIQTTSEATTKSETTIEAILQSTAAVVVGPTSGVAPPIPHQTTDKQQTTLKPTVKQQTTPKPTDKQQTTTKPTDKQQTTTKPTDKQQTTTTKPTDKQQTTAKPTVKQQTTTKPTDKQQTTTTKPTDKQQTTTKPTVKQETTTKAIVKQETTTKPTDKQQTTTKPTVKQQTTTKPTDKQQTTTKPTDKQQTTTKPTDKQQTTTKPTDKQQTTPRPVQTTPQATPKSKAKLTTKASLQSTAAVVGGPTPEVVKPPTPHQTTDKQQTTPITPRPVQTTQETTPKSKAKSTTEVTPKPIPKSTSSEPVTTSTITEKQSPKPTSKSIIVTEDCRDRRKACVKFAKYPGYCDYNKEFMEKHCPKSCGLCPVPSTPAPKTTRGILKTSPTVATELPVVTSELSTKVTSEPTPKITSESTSGVTTERLVGGPTSKKENEKYDVVFVIGAQNPNASESFYRQKKLIKEILKQSTLTDLRYGLVVYNHEAETKIRMNGFLPTVILNTLLDLITWKNEGTRVDKGVRKALKQFGGRPEAKQRIVVFTNEKSEASSEELVNEREKVENKGVKLIVVGMGDSYDRREIVAMAPDYEDRVYVDGTGPSDLEKGAAETVLAIMQDDETDSQQGGIPVEAIRIVGPKNPETAKFGDTLRWKIWPWGKCVDGKQSRVVRCYHFFEEHDYHVIIDACIQHVAPMADKERSC